MPLALLASRRLSQIGIRPLGKRTGSGIHWIAPGYEAAQSGGVISLAIESDARRVHWNKNYRRLGILVLGTLVASLPPMLALSQVFI